MFDLICCNADARAHGFERFFTLEQAKGRIAVCADLTAAAEHRNRKTLLSLRDYSFDPGAMKLIGEKKSACFLIDLGRIIRARGVPRAILLSRLRTFLRLCIKHGAFYAFASLAEKENEIRSPDELIHIAMLLGVNRGQARFALRMLPHYLP